MPIVIIIMPHVRRVSSNLGLYLSVPVPVPIFPAVLYCLILVSAAYLPLHQWRNLPYRSLSSPRQIASFEAIHQAREFQQVNYAK
jgi:hypothetical protein